MTLENPTMGSHDTDSAVVKFIGPTPGPWTVAHVAKSLDGNYGIDRAVPCVVSNGPTIAELLHSDNANADARLIAAAPDMLAALKLVVSRPDGWPNVPPSALVELGIKTHEAVQAAIAKATGAA